MATHTPAELRWAAEQLAAATREAGAQPHALDDRTHELFVYDEEEDEPALAKAGRA
jgi:hypothetical protein